MKQVKKNNIKFARQGQIQEIFKTVSEAFHETKKFV